MCLKKLYSILGKDDWCQDIYDSVTITSHGESTPTHTCYFVLVIDETINWKEGSLVLFISIQYNFSVKV